MEERSAPLRGMFVAESGHCTAEAVGVLLREIGGRCARLTVAAVAPGNTLVALWAPLAGLDPVSGRDERIAEASRAAHRTVGLFPAHISVSHQSAACWRDVLRLMDPEAYDLIAVSGLPARRGDRRALRRAADRAGARMVYA